MATNFHDIPQASWMYLFTTRAIEWLNPIVYLFGLGIALWAFWRCRKRGYLFVAVYFVLALFSLLVMPSIRIHQYLRDYDAQTRQKMDVAARNAREKVLAEEGHTMTSYTRTINLPVGPTLLVAGLWLVAKNEPADAALKS